MDRNLLARGRALSLVGLAIAELAAFAFAGCALVLTFCLGVGWFVLAPTLGLCRRLAVLARRQAREWSGVHIGEPYQPGPPLPVLGADGWYRHGRGLFRSPLVPAYNLRTLWMYTDPATWRDLLWTMLDPFVSLVLALAGIVVGAPALRARARWAGLLLAPTSRARLDRRVEHLAQTRTDVTDAQAAELRRIERDLHDGAQARLVAMSMTLAAADELVETDPTAARTLLAKVQDSFTKALTELRDLVRGIYPPVLAERGLADAVRALALDSPLDVEVRVDLRTRFAAPAESVVYFAVAEALTNAAKHADAERAWIDLRQRGARLVVSVADDGHGGADPSRGSGLRGIERRLAAFDGVLAVSSPPGGPTMVTMELPTAPRDGGDTETLPMSRASVLGTVWAVAGSVALWPQGVVPMVLMLADVDVRSWFLALHVPEPWGWPTAVVMMGLGQIGYVVSTRYYREGQEGDG
jgi:signal transduction histidine kinase